MFNKSQENKYGFTPKMLKFNRNGFLIKFHFENIKEFSLNNVAEYKIEFKSA